MSGDFRTPAPLLQACELLSDRPVLSNPPFALQQGHA